MPEVRLLLQDLQMEAQLYNLLIWPSFPKLREGDSFQGCPGVLRLLPGVLSSRGWCRAVVQDRQGEHPEVHCFLQAPLAQVD